jgi:DNA-binding transcriptional LysR family regulator
MKLDQLRYFLEAAKQQHLHKAAKTLAISQSAVSHSIRGLEEELGRKLFRKEGKNIFVTTEGHALAERVAVILGEPDNLKGELSSENALFEGYYRLGGTHGLSSWYVAPAWLELKKIHRKPVAEILSLRSGQVLEKVSTGELDLGICFNAHNHPRVNAERIAVSEAVVAVRTKHPLLKASREKVQRLLARYPFASAPEAPGVSSCNTHPIFALAGKPKADFYYDSFEVALSLLRQTDAWAIVPRCVLRAPGVQSIRVLEKDMHEEVRIMALWPKHCTLAPALKFLLERLRVDLDFSSAR